MPAKKGFCWCIGGSAPPEISYGLENGGMTLKPIEVDIPMPQDENELNAIFAELVVSTFTNLYRNYSHFLTYPYDNYRGRLRQLRWGAFNLIIANLITFEVDDLVWR